MTELAPFYVDDRVTVWHAEHLHGRGLGVDLPDASVDAIVTDPPYELGFMGRGWDSSGIAYDVALWEDCLRVLKPGGHLLAFGGSRTWHRLVCAVEDAGFEVRDSIAWVYASGFPKNLDVAKAITATQRHGGAASHLLRREAMGDDYVPSGRQGNRDGIGKFKGDGAVPFEHTPDAARWQGWGTALKPAFEPICVARKPLAGTVAATVLAHGTGALNIDGCRVAADDFVATFDRHDGGRPRDEYRTGRAVHGTRTDSGQGRWPSNLVLTHAPDCGPDDTTPCVDGCPVAELDAQSGVTKGVRSVRVKPGGVIGNGRTHGTFVASEANVGGFNDSGGASRFFPTFRYQAKAPTDERPRHDGTAHPTVKPLDLMRWLVRLVTPPGGVVLEPFAGSGTTCEAAALEGFRCIGIEKEAEHLPLITQRLTKRSDPVAHLASKGEDLGLFDLLDDDGEATG